MKKCSRKSAGPVCFLFSGIFLDNISIMIKERADDALISCILKKEKMPAGGWVSAGGRQFRNLKIHNRIKSNFNPSEPEDFHPQFLIGDEGQIAPQKSSDRIGSLLIRIADILPETVFSVLGFSCLHISGIIVPSHQRSPTQHDISRRLYDPSFH